MLESDELLVVRRDAVGELFPPALLGRLLGELQQERPAGSGDLVVVEQFRDLTRLQPGSGPLVPADLGR